MLVVGWVLQGVVGARGRTRTAQGHVAGRVGWVEVLVGVATGLVPGFTGYPSSTFVGTERVVVAVKEKLSLSNDEDTSGDESRYWNPKRWGEGVGSRRSR